MELNIDKKLKNFIEENIIVSHNINNVLYYK